MIEQVIEIRAGSSGIPARIEAVQVDSGRKLKCFLTDMTIPEGAVARIYGEKPSKLEIYNDCEISGNQVIVELTTQFLAEIGTVTCQVEITHEGKKVTSFDLFVVVKKSRVSGSAIESKDEFTALDNALKDAKGAAYSAVSEYIDANGLVSGATEEQAEQIEKNEEDISELSKEKVSMPKDSEGVPQTGVAGQVLESAGDGTTRWANITVTTESITNALGYKPADQEDISKLSKDVNTQVTELKGDLSQLSLEIINVVNVDIPISIHDWVLNADGTFGGGTEEIELSEYMEVNEGDIYLYRGGWYVPNRAGVCCYDSAKNFISVLVGSEQVPSHKTTDFVKFEIPKNAKYIIVCSNNVYDYPLELKKETHYISYLLSKEKELASEIKEIEKELTIDVIRIGNNNLLPLGNKLESERVVCFTKTASGFASGKIESPVVFWDSKQLKYGMTFTGYGKDTDGNLTKGNIGIAWSDDLETWEVEENPLFTESNIEGSADFGSVTGGFVYVENGVYYLFYIGCSEAGYEQGVKSICLAYGTDIYNLQRYSGNPLVMPSGGRIWTSDNIYKPSVYKIGGKYYMFFNAQGWCDNDVELFGESIGYATSEDLFNWKVSANSVLKPTKGNQSAPDGYIVGDASLYDIGDENIYMAYFAFGNGTSIDDAKDWIAYTSKANFPNGWVKYGKPITPRKWDCKPCIIYRAGVQYHFCGAGGNELVYYKAI